MRYFSIKIICTFRCADFQSPIKPAVHLIQESSGDSASISTHAAYGFKDGNVCAGVVGFLR